VKTFVKKFMHQFLSEFHTCDIAIAKSLKINHIGQVIYFKYLYKENQEVLWIKQLVVHKEHCNKGVATCTIWKLWTKSNAWVSCHAYVANAHKDLSMKHVDKLIQRDCLPYIRKCKIAFSPEKCVIQRRFYTKHPTV
jgi:hypothetical protein